MSSISDYHQYLFLGKITNSLNEEEDNELQELFSKNPQAEQAYQEMLSRLPSNKVADSFHELNVPGFWKNVPGEIRKEEAKTRRKKILQIVGIVVIIVGIGVGGWSVYTNNKKAQDIQITKKNGIN